MVPRKSDGRPPGRPRWSMSSWPASGQNYGL